MLDYFSLKLKCMYLSDLRFLDLAQRMDLAVIARRAATDKFSAKEWNEALQYITGKRGGCLDAASAKDELIAWLTNSCAH